MIRRAELKKVLNFLSWEQPERAILKGSLESGFGLNGVSMGTYLAAFCAEPFVQIDQEHRDLPLLYLWDRAKANRLCPPFLNFIAHELGTGAVIQFDEADRKAQIYLKVSVRKSAMEMYWRYVHGCPRHGGSSCPCGWYQEGYDFVRKPVGWF